MKRLLFVLAASAAWIACGDSNSGGPAPYRPTGPGYLMGTIRDMYGEPAPMATVAVAGATHQINEQGWFFIPDVDEGERIPVVISADGFVTTQKVVAVRAGRQTFVDVRLFAREASQDVDAEGGGSISFGKSGLELPPGALRTKAGAVFKGTARISITNLDPSSAEARLGTPGDFTAFERGSQTPRKLESFGMVDLNIEGEDGEELVAGETTVIKIARAEAAQAAEEMPLWRYDREAGRWIEEGSLAFDPDCDCYVGEVTRSASWNADRVYETACVTGRIIRPDGTPAVGGVTVIAEGVSYVGDSSAWTQEGGKFTVDVMASTESSSASVQIRAQGGGVYTETPFLVARTPVDLASTGKCLDVGDIELSYPLGMMVLTWGEQPYDLDSHFTGPKTKESEWDSDRFHVYYGDRDSSSTAFLDTDDTSSYGPEVVSLLETVPGTYLYSVHNFSHESSGRIAESGAKVQVYFSQEAVTFDVATATNRLVDGDESSIWRVFSFTIDDEGNIGRIKPINEILAGEYMDPAMVDP